MYPSLEKTEKIRVLVGLQTDRSTLDLLEQARTQGKLDFLSHAEAKEAVPGNILQELEKAPDTVEVEEGIRTFIEWVRSGKLEVKAYPSGNLHAKLYIVTFVDGHIDKGRVITGSSNFTQAGLQDNLEFNVELKNRADYEFSYAKFNELWAHAVDLNQTYVETVEQQSPYAHFTPYELYLKLLYEYFKGELNRPAELEDVYFPGGFRKLKYQEEAVLSAKRILEEYGGVFLSDVVGLGKTYMSALLARELEGRTLVIAPPSLLDRNNPGSWPNVFGDFGVRQTEFISSGKIEDLLHRDVSKYANVFIDESHRFRTETNQTYERLAQICRGKRVVLVSATPLNNYPTDILSQIKLFQNGKNSTIPNARNLESFFNTLVKKLRGLDRQADRTQYFSAVRENAVAIRERVLKYLMIRRTRAEIMKYYGADLAAQGLRFPDVTDPEPLFYTFDKTEDEAFSSTMNRVIHEFRYVRYKPLSPEYYKGEVDVLEQQSQVNLARFMRILLVKRLESSIHAFTLTLDRFIRSYERFIEEFENGYVYSSKKHIGKIFDLLEVGDEEGVQRLIDQEKAERLPASDFKPNFLADLKQDLKVLREVRLLWTNMKHDPKWTAFSDLLVSHPRLTSGKLIIFTESRETAEYLAGKIADEVEPKVASFSGQSDTATRQRIIENFDAKAFQTRDDYRILVTTDVLSEGVNLHRSNTVINYDIPWNPTRLMQRVGRVNRVDTAFSEIHTFNFFPSKQGNDLLKLKEAAEAKIQAFIEMLGADARLLTEGEEIKSHDLFAQLNSKVTITGEDTGEESELEYLTEIRKVRDEQQDLFVRIKRLPKKARSTRDRGALAAPAIIQDPPSLLTYFRQGKLDKFFLGDGEQAAPKELDFLTAVKYLKPADTAEVRKPIPQQFYRLLDRNKAAFQTATTAENEDTAPATSARSNELYVLRRLRTPEIRRCKAFTDEDETFVGELMQLLEDGALPKPTTKKLAAALKTEVEPLKVLGILRREIPREFFIATRAELSRHARSPREVILSSYIV
jgi:superfamily II DNA/RNA helicase